MPFAVLGVAEDEEAKGPVIPTPIIELFMGCPCPLKKLIYLCSKTNPSYLIIPFFSSFVLTSFGSIASPTNGL